MSDGLDLLVRVMRWEAEGVLGLELVPVVPGTLLPVVEAGAHLDLHLPGGRLRSYSLLNPGEQTRYCLAVNLDPQGRGGSRAVHEQLRPGQRLMASVPRNHFALDEAAPHSVFIAGGIGITPILAMVRRLVALGRPWTLHVAARSPARAAFVDELNELAAQGGGHIERVHDEGPGGRRLDLDAIVAALPAGAHVYCCGPAGMLEAFERATITLPRERVHVEHFSPKDAPATAGGYTVTLHRSGRRLTVAPGQTLLACLIEAGAEPPWSCGQGICGTCETRVLDGVPDHRDLVLDEAEHAANDRMMVCCSGAKTATLVLDL